MSLRAEGEPVPGMVSVVVPVYNEEDNVEPLLEALEAALEGLGRPYEVILVDDGSTDGTVSRLRGAVARFPTLRVVRLRSNFGQRRRWRPASISRAAS